MLCVHTGCVGRAVAFCTRFAQHQINWLHLSPPLHELENNESAEFEESRTLKHSDVESKHVFLSPML
jgi:hypothetical protein